MQIIPIIQKHRKTIFLAALSVGILLIIVTVVCYYKIDGYKKFIVSAEPATQTKVGLVLGAGISKEGKPFDELKARLDSAAKALQNGTVDHLLLSGDNRFDYYNEPAAMKQYLTDTHDIAAEELTEDFAGRSTYESCERAAKVFGLKNVLIFSAGSHLPRAIYLCRHFGIDAYGIASGLEANNSSRREPLARVKAIYNTVIKGERTVLGNPIPL